MLVSITNELLVYQVEAIRSLGFEAFCSARISLVEAAHVYDSCPEGTGAAYAGFSDWSPMTLKPSAPYEVRQFPCVVVSVLTKVAVAAGVPASPEPDTRMFCGDPAALSATLSEPLR